MTTAAKDYLGRPLAVDDFVIYIRHGYRQLHLAKIYAVLTSGKVRIRFGEHTWQTLLQEGSQLVKVEGPDLTYFLLNQKG